MCPGHPCCPQWMSKSASPSTVELVSYVQNCAKCSKVSISRGPAVNSVFLPSVVSPLARLLTNLSGIICDHHSSAHSARPSVCSANRTELTIKGEGFACGHCACAKLFWAPALHSDTAAPTIFRNHFWSYGHKFRT